MKKFEEQFKKGLKTYMHDKMIKQSALADKANIGQDTLSRLLNGKRRVFVDEAARICDVIGLSIDEILNYTADEQAATREVS